MTSYSTLLLGGAFVIAAAAPAAADSLTPLLGPHTSSVTRQAPVQAQQAKPRNTLAARLPAAAAALRISPQMLANVMMAIERLNH